MLRMLFQRKIIKCFLAIVSCLVLLASMLQPSYIILASSSDDGVSGDGAAPPSAGVAGEPAGTEPAAEQSPAAGESAPLEDASGGAPADAAQAEPPGPEQEITPPGQPESEPSASAGQFSIMALDEPLDLPEQIDTFAKLQQAISAAQTGDTISLAADITLESSLSLTSKNLVIEGNNHTLSLADGMTGYHIINTGTDTLVRNLTLQGHNSGLPGELSSRLEGGGVENGYRAYKITLENCTITGNHSSGSGGGIANANGQLVLLNTQVINNSAPRYGGGIAASSNAQISITGGSLSYNRTYGTQAHYDGGGGIFSNSGVGLILNGVEIRGNSSNRGGAILLEYPTPITATNCTFADNEALYNGGAVSASTDQNVPQNTFTNCTFSGNQAGKYGGALYCDYRSSIVGGSFTNNHAGTAGGAIYNNRKDHLSIDGPVFGGNTCAAGGIYWNEQLSAAELKNPAYGDYQYWPLLHGYYWAGVVNVTTCSQQAGAPLAYTNIFNNLDVDTSNLFATILCAMDGAWQYPDSAYEPGEENFKDFYLGNVPVPTSNMERSYWFLGSNGYEEGFEEDYPYKTGYVLEGWYRSYDAASGTYSDRFEADAVITQSMILYAKWLPDNGGGLPPTYSLTFDANGGAWANQQTQQTAELAATAEFSAPATAPQRSGYQFAGWYLDTAGNGSAYPFPGSMPAEPLTLYAKWSVTGGSGGGTTTEPAATEYLLTFNANGGSWDNGTASQTKYLTKDARITAPSAPLRSGYQLAGWQTATGADYNFPGNMPAANLTLYAQWEAVTQALEYTLTFDANGGAWPSGEDNRQTSLAEGAAIQALTEAPQRAGYTLAGWYADDSTALWDFAADTSRMPAEDLRLSAKWLQEEGLAGPQQIKPPDPQNPLTPTNGGTIIRNADGSYTEISTLGVPLYHWLLNDDGTWVVAEDAPLGQLPQTGAGGLPLSTLLTLAGFALFMLCLLCWHRDNQAAKRSQKFNL